MCRRCSKFSIGPIVALLVCAAADADDSRGIRLGDETISKWRFGVVVQATGGPISGINATLPVPMDWPEQSVKKVGEEKSPHVASINYRVLEASPKQPGVKQMVIAISRIAAGDEATAMVTFEVHKRQIEEPAETSVYQIPKSDRELARFLNPSPYIESKDPKVKSLASQVISGKDHAWDQVAAIFDWVRANVKYEFAEQIKPATAALKDGQGDCEELSSLVIAMCRASKIPGRAVWVPGHTYPEFCLADEAGKVHWFPCQAAGADRQFGSMNEARPILQKGDNFTVSGVPQRYVKPTLSAKDAAAPPEVRFIMEQVKD
jgi:hypothetical protein